MSKKLLALDIDGTLTNTQKDITPATLEKIIEAQEKGNIVAIASGRPLPGIRKIADTIELDRFGGYVLAFNGGRIVDYSTGEVVYQAVLDNDVVRDIYDYCLKAGCGMVTYDGDRVITGTDIDGYMTFEASINHMEIMPPNVHKATSLEKLLEVLDMDRKDLVACGDGYNDLTMIEYAGVGVAMANAQDIVKEHADYITLSNDEDGLVPVVDKFILAD